MDPAGTPARDGGGGKAPGRNGHAHFSAEELLELADADHDAKITYEDFRRLLLAQPDNALTRVCVGPVPGVACAAAVSVGWFPFPHMQLLTGGRACC